MKARYLFLLLSLSQDWQLAILLLVAKRADGKALLLWNRQKIDILSEQQNHRCCYCGVRFDEPDEGADRARRRWRAANDGNPRMATIEHVVRKVDGGLPVWDNEVAACADCNHRRDDVDAYAFFGRRAEVEAGRKATKRAAKKRQEKRRRQRRHAWNAERALGTMASLWPVQLVPPDGFEPPTPSV